ncbi:hypothetical protein RHGRI_032327 [Rhododendron griersonianum]|uniref:Pectinesterase inhibitor domain-containing protein n=1 Tax=Rhododendron griersonianum TaxID=479676 RepID=A0AAV6IDW2_9ERIC|nr:hypothetical protein RHGRI_032327 [Rhododendron griersonianum]
MACNISPPIFFLLVSSMLSLSCVMAQDRVNKVCAKTSNPGFCVAVLRSDRRSATADYTGLGHIAINLAVSSIVATFKKIQVLSVTRGLNPILKKPLDSCFADYAKTSDILANARFKALKPRYQSPVTRNNRDTELFAEIIRAIASLLQTS